MSLDRSHRVSTMPVRAISLVWHAGDWRRRIISETALAILAFTCLFACAHASPIAQMNHRLWSVSNGAPADIWDMRQDELGFLWLATGSGLVRFDGLHFERFTPIPGERLASTDLTAMHLRSSRDLWVGTARGFVSHIFDGHVTNYAVPGVAGDATIFCIASTPDGAVWVVSSQKLIRFKDGRYEIIDAQWNLPSGRRPSWMVVDTHGTAWLAVDGGLYVLRQGSRRFESTGIPMGWYATLAISPTGTLWASDDSYGTRALPGLSVDKVPDSLTHPTKPMGSFPSARLAFDHEGALWGTVNMAGHLNGVYRLHNPQDYATGQPLLADAILDRYTAADGLVSVNAVPVVIDREGDTWIGSNFGLSRFHANNFHTLVIPGMPTGMMWIGQSRSGKLMVLQNGCLYELRAVIPEQLTCDLPSTNQSGLFVTDNAVFTSTERSVFSWERSGIARELDYPSSKPRSFINATTTDREDRLWIALRGEMSDPTYLRSTGHSWVPFDLSPGIHRAHATAMHFDGKGAAWVGFSDGRVSRWDVRSLRTYDSMTGLDVGAVEAIDERRGIVLVAGEMGVSRSTENGFQTLSMARLGLSGSVTGALQTSSGDLWLNTSRGVVRIERAEATRAFDDGRYTPTYSLYGSDDGVNGVALMHPASSTIFEDDGGRLWFANNQGVSWVDPATLPIHGVAPRAIVESVSANGQVHPTRSEITLDAPALSVTFQYTAASFFSPQNVKFRYRLRGLDNAWQISTTDRQATFANLGPGSYTFDVVAANASGVWSDEAASVTLVIEPAFYQVRRFQILMGVTIVFCLLLGVVAQYRRAVGRIRDMLEVRHAERERIARHLHDTLIQGVQALILGFQAIADQIPAHEPLRRSAERSLNRADVFLEEARDRVQDMRTHEHVSTDVSLAFALLGEELASAGPASFRLSITGDRRHMDPVVSEEIFLVGREAMLNAFTHSAGSLVDLSLTYGLRDFRLSCTDNGKGIDAATLSVGQKPGHWGLPGMRERAESMGGTLEICSNHGGGTEVVLIIPARLAYLIERRFWWNGFMHLLTLGRQNRSQRLSDRPHTDDRG